MVSVIVTYEDGTSSRFEHITTVSYNDRGNGVVVKEDDLPSHYYPVGKPLWLFSDNGAVAISGTGLRFVDVKKE